MPFLFGVFIYRDKERDFQGIHTNEYTVLHGSIVNAWTYNKSKVWTNNTNDNGSGNPIP